MNQYLECAETYTLILLAMVDTEYLVDEYYNIITACPG